MDYPYVVTPRGPGVVVAAGPDAEAQAGDHVAWSEASGSYAEYVVVTAENVLPVPESLDLRTARRCCRA